VIELYGMEVVLTQPRGRTRRRRIRRGPSNCWSRSSAASRGLLATLLRADHQEAPSQGFLQVAAAGCCRKPEVVENEPERGKKYWQNRVFELVFLSALDTNW